MYYKKETVTDCGVDIRCLRKAVFTYNFFIKSRTQYWSVKAIFYFIFS